MKKFLITLLVLVLVGALLFGLYYFLWTPENFAALGRNAMENGKYSHAIFCFTRAAEMAPTDPDHVLSLADACIADGGNYTQAERSLVNAIKAAPSSALYLKLSSLYIAQDKLMDAQKMLDSVTDAAIRAELDAMRPAAPVFTPAAGEYDELISVDFEAAEGEIYYSLTDEYPSLATAAYAEPIALAAGQTHIRAIVVGANGLVSPAAEADYLIVGVIEDVTFASAELEAYVRDTLFIPRTSAVTTEDLWAITELEVPEDVTDFSDLRHFTNLQSLSIHSISLGDCSFLQATTALTELDLSGSILSSDALALIGALPELRVLDLSGCGLSAIRDLSSLTELEELDLSGNSISDISALAEMTKLTSLNLQNNAVTSLSALKNMRALVTLDLRNNRVSDLSPLYSSYNLTELLLDNNNLTDLSAVAEMKQLRRLSASHNALTDASPLAVCTALTQLELSDNQLTDIGVIVSMPNLTYLDISRNAITELPVMEVTVHLQQLYASYNQLTDVSPLAGLSELTYVDVDYNEEIEDIECLASCALLVQVNAFGTEVAEVKTLTDMGVIVNYDPTNEDD